ncbi:MAG: molybdopterin-dependent oxidoreductase [Chthoniobacterales bacterium]
MKRRAFMRGALVAAAGACLGACDRLTSSPAVVKILDGAEGLNRRVTRVLARKALAPEFPASAISAEFHANGSTNPERESYRKLAANHFADYRLEIGGLVERPLQFSLDELRAAPSRTQITRHDCVEGWSCIGQWRGAKLGPLLDRAGLKPNARYLAFFCADTLEQSLDGSGDYYETIDLDDAYHEQTILAYEMNGAVLPIPHGAPLRLRLERQLGYKMAKYIMRIEAVENFAHISGGKGGYWEDRGYAWYAGI